MNMGVSQSGPRATPAIGVAGQDAPDSASSLDLAPWEIGGGASQPIGTDALPADPPPPPSPPAPAPSWLGALREDDFTADAAAEPRAWGEISIAVVLALIAIGWIGAIGAIFATTRTLTTDPLAIATWIGLAAAPLALLGVLWLVLAQGSRSQSRRYGRTARAVRLDSDRLVTVLATLTERLEEGRVLLDTHSQQLDALGHGTVARFAAAGDAIRQESVDFQRLADMLDTSSRVARGDLDSLIVAMPEADEQARRIAATLRSARTGAQEQIDELERKLTAMAESAYRADTQVTTSADRLASQLGQIGLSGAQTARRIDEAAQGLEQMVAQSLDTAGQAIDATRRGVAEQAAALTALVDQARAALDRAGLDQTSALGRRLDDVTGRIDGFVDRITSQDAASLTLVANLEIALDRIDERFDALGISGAERTADLAESLVALATHAEHVSRSMGSGTTAASTLLDRVSTVRRVLDSNARDLEDAIPAALSRLRLHAERSLAAIGTAIPQVETLATTTETTAKRLEEIATSVEQQGQAIVQLGSDVDGRLAGVRDQARALNRLVAETGQNADMLAGDTAGRLEEAMLRIRDTAAAASGQARAALATIVPEISDDLASALQETMERVLTERVKHHVAGLSAAAGDAAEAADRAVSQLSAKLSDITDAAATTQARIEEMLTERAAAQVATVTAAADTVAVTADRAAERLTRQIAGITDAAEAMQARVDRMVTERTRDQVAGLSGVADQAIAAADRAADHLWRQMNAVTDAAAAMETRVAEARETADSHDQAAFSRQVALLVESLNSSAIDVAKILSQDIADTAWAAYLRGDRGVFTRRAVRLLDSSETRELLKKYSGEPDFREQVNRYIHDFETMLRRVLSSRDGGPLGVTMLSSDMGKLYVALAQSIERLRG